VRLAADAGMTLIGCWRRLRSWCSWP